MQQESHEHALYKICSWTCIMLLKMLGSRHTELHCELAYSACLTCEFAICSVQLQAWRVAHPPARGSRLLFTRPLVHVGFLKSWLAGGFNLKVISAVLQAVQHCRSLQSPADKITVFVTGQDCCTGLCTNNSLCSKMSCTRALQSSPVILCNAVESCASVWRYQHVLVRQQIARDACAVIRLCLQQEYDSVVLQVIPWGVPWQHWRHMTYTPT